MSTIGAYRAFIWKDLKWILRGKRANRQLILSVIVFVVVLGFIMVQSTEFTSSEMLKRLFDLDRIRQGWFQVMLGMGGLFAAYTGLEIIVEERVGKRLLALKASPVDWKQVVLAKCTVVACFGLMGAVAGALLQGGVFWWVVTRGLGSPEVVMGPGNGWPETLMAMGVWTAYGGIGALVVSGAVFVAGATSATVKEANMKILVVLLIFFYGHNMLDLVHWSNVLNDEVSMWVPVVNFFQVASEARAGGIDVFGVGIVLLTNGAAVIGGVWAGGRVYWRSGG